MKFGQRVEQIAYVVIDVREAALQHSNLYGSGPFFVWDKVEVPYSWHRGKEWPYDFSAALGWSGDVMIELLQEKSELPSMLNDLYPFGNGKTGLHHFCYHIDDLEKSVEEFERAGFPVISKIRMGGGTEVRMIDTAKVNGHYTEIYEKTPEIAAFYSAVRDAAVGFNGSNPLRPIEDLFAAIQ